MNLIKVGMRKNFSHIIKVSRPKFWLYLSGPILIAVASLSSHNFSVREIIFISSLFIITSICGNIFVYGVNDLSDGDTDAMNDKKDGYESRVEDSTWSIVARASVLSGVALTIPIIFLSGFSFLYWVGFLFLSWAYSARPFRCKARPFVDSLSNILYVLPAFSIYTHITNHVVPVSVMLGAWCWTASMHLYSAIPDIESDARASLKTTAVVLGERKSLVVCFLLWALSGIFIAPVGFFWIFSLPYISIIGWCLYKKYTRIDLMRVYKNFPLVNGVVGFLLFIATVLYAYRG